MNTTIHIRRVSNGLVVTAGYSDGGYGFDRVPVETYFPDQASLMNAMPLIAADAIAAADADLAHRNDRAFANECSAEKQQSGDYPLGRVGSPPIVTSPTPVEVPGTKPIIIGAGDPVVLQDEGDLQAEPLAEPESEPVEEVATVEEFLHPEPAVTVRTDIEADEQGFGTNGS